NLALAMGALGWRIGLMDADVYGPSIAMMVGAREQVRVTPERRIVPLERFGIRYVSMALFIGDDTAVIWRGPMVTKLESEFLFNVEWGELDCLVLDLPPGTGAAQLTITQRVTLDGGVLVTTQQDIALPEHPRKSPRKRSCLRSSISRRVSISICSTSRSSRVRTLATRKPTSATASNSAGAAEATFFR